MAPADPRGAHRPSGKHETGSTTLDPAGHRPGLLPVSWLLFVVRPTLVLPAQRGLRGPRRARVHVPRRRAPGVGDRPYDGAFAADYGSFDRWPTCSARSATTNGCTKTDPSRRSSNRASDSTPHLPPTAERQSPQRCCGQPLVLFDTAQPIAVLAPMRAETATAGGDRDGSGAGPDPGLRQRGGALREGARVTDATGVP